MNNLLSNKEIDQSENVRKGDKVQKIRKEFYDFENNLALPRDANCYFNWKYSQFSNSTMDKKLKELRYLLSQGFNLKQSIFDYIKVKDVYVKSSISKTFIFYIMYIRYKDYYHFISEILEKLSENNLIKLFIEELNLVYDPLEHEITCMFWSDKDVMEAAKALETVKGAKENRSEKDKLNSVISSNQMVKAAIMKEIKID